MTRRGLLAMTMAVAAALCSTHSRAQDAAAGSRSPPWYIGGEGGWTELGSEKGRLPTKTFLQSWHDGYNLGARIGYEAGPWRVEEEFRYQENGLIQIGLHPAQGFRTAYALMINAIYDFNFGWPVSPHVGAGIGAVGLHDKGKVAILGIPSVSDATDWALGYQAIAGLRYDITPELAVDVDYHYLATTRGHYITSPSLIVDGVYTGNIKYTSGYATQSILASLIWRFDAPMLPLPPH